VIALHDGPALPVGQAEIYSRARRGGGTLHTLPLNARGGRPFDEAPAERNFVPEAENDSLAFADFFFYLRSVPALKPIHWRRTS
jgi:hypothetical protein